jgi:transposase-like protein
MTARDTREVVKELSGVEVTRTVSEITAGLDAEATAWRTRRLDAARPIAYLDGIVVHVRGESGRVSRHATDVATGVDLQGRKEWPGQAEGAEFRPSCLTDLRGRGVEDISIVCVDGLGGSPEAIRGASPETKVQLRIARPVRSALKYTTETDGREVASDLRTTHQSATVPEAEGASERFATKRDAGCPRIARRWRSQWGQVVTPSGSPGGIRRAISATDAIGGVNGVIREFTRGRKQCPDAGSALEWVGPAIREASRKWTMPIVGWEAALDHSAIVFEGRLPTRPSN